MSRNPYAPPNADVRDVTDLAVRSALTFRLFSPGQIALATFLGSPMAGAWFISSNLKALARPDEAQRALLFGVAGTIFVLVIAFLLPENLPNSIFPVIYTVAVHAVAKSLFAKTIAEHTSAGGSLGSGWRVVGVSLLILLALLVVLFAVLLLLDLFGALPEDL